MTSRPLYGGFARRAAALAIDTVLVYAACWAVDLLMRGGYAAMAWGAHAAWGARWADYDDAWNPFALELFETGVLICLSAPYFILGPALYGGTLGKRWLGLEIRDLASLGKPTRGQLIRRYLGYPVSLSILFCGFLMALFHPRKRTLHDWIGGTVVLRAVTGLALGWCALLASPLDARAAPARPEFSAAWFHAAGVNGGELGAALRLQLLEDHWVYFGPRAQLRMIPDRLDGYAGLESRAWIGNAVGPGLAADWRYSGGAFRLEPSLGLRLGYFGWKGAWSLRLGAPHDSLEGWGWKLGLAIELGGVTL